MRTKDDEIKWEIERLQYAINLARADERKQIQKILNRGLLHSKDKAIDDIINYLKKAD